MAKSKVNKSQAIRDLVGEDPKLKSKEIVTRLGERGIKVSPAMVYFVRSRMKHAKRRQKREKVAATSRTPGSNNPADLVLKVRELAKAVGGFKNLKQLVEVLAE